MRAVELVEQLLQLDIAWKVNQVNYNEASRCLFISIETEQPTFCCPKCGAESCPVLNISEEQLPTWPFFKAQTYFLAKVPTVVCRKCGKRKVKPTFRSRTVITSLPQEMISDNKALDDICDKFRISRDSWPAVRRLEQSVANEMMLVRIASSFRSRNKKLDAAIKLLRHAQAEWQRDTNEASEGESIGPRDFARTFEDAAAPLERMRDEWKEMGERLELGSRGSVRMSREAIAIRLLQRIWLGSRRVANPDTDELREFSKAVLMALWGNHPSFEAESVSRHLTRFLRANATKKT